LAGVLRSLVKKTCSWGISWNNQHFLLAREADVVYDAEQVVCAKINKKK
jgi:hypothetical protein